jgi:hypothetical protein
MRRVVGADVGIVGKGVRPVAMLGFATTFLIHTLE